MVSTGFGAMGDYTMAGVAVPPLQPAWHAVGFAAMPHLDGVVDALFLTKH